MHTPHTPHTRSARWLLALTALLAAGIMSGRALAVDALPVTKKWVINPSALSTGGGYTLNGVIGQSVTARANVGSYILNGGYLAGGSPPPDAFLYLPNVMGSPDLPFSASEETP